MTSNDSATATPEAIGNPANGDGRPETNEMGTHQAEKNQPEKPLYWRSLSEFRGGEDFEQYLHREFPVAASEFPEGVSRRRWMQLMGASLALVGAGGCRYPEETIAPFVIRPEGRIPGETYSRATNFELAGQVYNLLITCFDGRPLKIEPNNDHPAASGTDVYSQASILSLYDPDRGRMNDGPVIQKTVKRRIGVAWSDFEAEAAVLMNEAAQTEGASFAVLMSPSASPSLQRMLAALKEKLPKATVCQFNGVDGDAMHQATTELFGKPAKQVLSLDQADVIVAIQADILGNGCGSLGNSAGFAANRDPSDGKMNRLYVVEGGYTTTGASADARLALRPSQMPAFLAELRRRVEKLKAGESHEHPEEQKPFDQVTQAERLERFLDALSHDLADAGEKAVVVVGDHLGADAITAGVRMNQMLGSFGKAQSFTAVPSRDASLGELVDKINGGEVETLLMLGDNPAQTAPGDVDLATAITKLKHSVYLGQYDDETALLCDWSLPMAHPLESWGDCVNDRGHYGVCQPQILPLLGGRTAIEVLARMLGQQEDEGSQIVRRTADGIGSGALSNRQWRQLLHDGYAADLVVQSPALTPSGEAKELTSSAPEAFTAVDKDEIEVVFQPADGLYDGRFANNGWLQELPQKLTKLCWDNAAVMSPGTAAALDLKHGLMVALRVGDSKVELPVYEMPGCAAGVVTATIGYGRERAGMVGGFTEKDVPVVGTDVAPIRRSDAMLVAYNVEARPRFEEYELATTQNHWAIDELGRDETASRSFTLVREGTLELLEKVPEFAESKGPHVPAVGKNASGSPWKEPIDRIEEENPQLPQWGMSIDLNKCSGCNACVIACQSENNVPIVGREQVINSREMHWLRVDRYFQGDEENADIVQEPMACQHCETAPCEQVCPVAATVHTEEGINAMAYNRCIGTRYCANNCPFKVRRFNYFNYNEDIGVGYGVKAYEGTIESANRKLQAMVMNPDVTVRGRGVMEKCTYCIQRVENAKITARKEDRKIADGDVVTACQSACPSNAIEFGNLADPDSRVSKSRENPRSYGMLGQLNVKPRTEYLARIRNTPASLMTARQLEDLATIKAPHHGDHGHGDHGHGEHGHGDHGHDEHGEDEHGTDEHGTDEHGDEKQHGAEASHEADAPHDKETEQESEAAANE